MLRITTGFLTGNLLPDRTPSPEAVNRYVYALHRALTAANPGFEVRVLQENGCGSVPAGLRTRVIGVDDRSERDFIEQGVEAVVQKTWETWSRSEAALSDLEAARSMRHGDERTEALRSICQEYPGTGAAAEASSLLGESEAEAVEHLAEKSASRRCGWPAGM